MLRICEEESRIFPTRERAPYMICVELYRPEEENKFNQHQQKLQKKPNGDKSLIDRIKSNLSSNISITKIVKEAEKYNSKPIIVSQFKVKRSSQMMLEDYKSPMCDDEEEGGSA